MLSETQRDVLRRLAAGDEEAIVNELDEHGCHWRYKLADLPAPAQDDLNDLWEHDYIKGTAMNPWYEEWTITPAGRAALGESGEGEA